jgi:hypothetical protein
MLVIALVAMTSCSDNIDNYAEKTLESSYDAAAGHWFAELPISGETDNWRTEEEGDKTTFDKVTAIVYLGDHVMKEGWWGYLYLQSDDEMVNYGGLDLSQHDTQFSFYMTADGHITPSSHIQNMPQVTNMMYDSVNDIITGDVTYNGQSYQLTFIRPSDDEWERLNEYFYILLEEDIVGGYDDEGDHLITDVTDEDAGEPSRARKF